MGAMIQVDDEIQLTLAKLATEKGLDIFSPATPNLVLRIELGLQGSQSSASRTLPSQSARQAPTDTTENEPPSPRTHNRSHQRIGPRLLREHGLNCKKGYFSKTGVPYQKPDMFPAVFFDPSGYLIVSDEASMRGNPQINVGKQVSVPGGISTLKDYEKCAHTHS